MELYTVQRFNKGENSWEDIDMAKEVPYQKALGFIQKISQVGGKIDHLRIQKL
jgi:hypothetical protein